MDIFIDKLAQKITASETIRANTAAETKEINELKAKIEGYEDLLTDIRRLNLKNMESAEVLSEMIDSNAGQAGKLADIVAKNEQNIKRLEEMFEESLKTLEQEGDGEELSEEELAEEELNREYMDEIYEKTSEVVHQESVRVYRNVQAAMQLGLKEQTESLINAKSSEMPEKKNTFLNVMSVIILIAVLGDIAIKILDVMGIF